MGRRTRLSLSLSPSRTLVTPYCKRIRPGRRTTRGCGSPYCFPLVFRLAPTHLGWDTQRQFTRRSRDPPRGRNADKCLKAKGVKLNPEKCVFGVPRGMLLGFIVSERGIEAKPEKIVAITNMGPIKDLKGVQRVMGGLAALSRFISCLGERGLPLYRLLRKTERFSWTPEAEETLGNLKALLTSVPILVPPAAGEALLIYVTATTQVVNAAIVVER
jgi:hypothetical protein